MLGDGNCNSACPSDPDCSTDDSNDGNYYLIIVILIPILGGILIIIIVLFIIYYKISKKRANERKNSSSTESQMLFNSVKFETTLKYKGEALCTLDLKEIKAGEVVAIMEKCEHIFHLKCLLERYEKVGCKECILCNPEDLESNRT